MFHCPHRSAVLSLILAAFLLTNAGTLRAEEEKRALFQAGYGLSSFEYRTPGSMAPSPILIAEPALSLDTIRLFQIHQALRTFPTEYTGKTRNVRFGAEWPLFLQGRISVTLDLSARTVHTSCTSNCPGLQSGLLFLATDQATREIAEADPARPYAPNLSLIYNTARAVKASSWTRTEYALESALRLHSMPDRTWNPYADLGIGAGLCPGSANECTLVKLRLSPGVRYRFTENRALFLQIDREYVSYKFSGDKRYRKLLPETGILFGVQFRSEPHSESDTEDEDY